MEVIMDQKDITRINELYKKQKAGTLTPEEALEQSKLRHEYIAAIRKNLRGSLESIQIQEEDGSITDVKKRHEKSMAQRKENAN